MQLQSILLQSFMAPGQKMFGTTPQKDWQRYCPANDDGDCNWALRSLLIKDNENTILIDSGFAQGFPDVVKEYGMENFKSSLDILKTSGIDNHSLTHVIHTHLHLDHCGGSFYQSEKGFQPAFKNAHYIVSNQQLITAQKPELIEVDSFQPEIVNALASYKKLQQIELETFLTPQIELCLFNGHTHGLIVPVIHSKRQSIVFAGDLIPSAAHLILQSASAYDMNPLLSLAERTDFLEEAYDNGCILFFQHDAMHECCNLKRVNGLIIPDEYFELQDVVL